MLIKFNDPELFGSEVAEKDPEDLFLGYAVRRPEIENFLDSFAASSL
jgi:hypothetical protein